MDWVLQVSTMLCSAETGLGANKHKKYVCVVADVMHW